MSRRSSRRAGWIPVGAMLFAVGWGANQFTPMLVAYRERLGLAASTLALLFGVYAVALVPGLLLGGPLSDRVGRRRVVLVFAAMSPAATALLMVGSHTVALLAAGRFVAGLCSGTVFGAGTAWVRDLSSAETAAPRAATALSAGFGTGPLVAALLAQWAPSPLVLAYLPHVAVGIAAVLAGLFVPETVRRERSSGAVRVLGADRSLVASLAPIAPWVFTMPAIGAAVLPESVGGGTSVAVAGVVTALVLASGVAIQPLARRIDRGGRLRAAALGLALGAGALALGAAAVGWNAEAVVVADSVPFGLAYGLCLVSGLRETERLAPPDRRGAFVGTYYALTYVGFASPYVVALLGRVARESVTLLAIAVACGACSLYASTLVRVTTPGAAPRLPRRRTRLGRGTSR